MRSNSVQHLTAQRAADYALGKLPEAEMAALDDHLVNCDRCRSLVEGQGEDSFVRALKDVSIGADSSAATTPYTSAYQTNELGATPDDVACALARSGRFRVLGRLGQGGMGAVYKAEQVGLDRPVVLKVIRP